MGDTKTQLSTYAWRPRLFRAVGVFMTGTVAIFEASNVASWTEVPAALGPIGVMSLAVSVFWAATTGGPQPKG